MSLPALDTPVMLRIPDREAVAGHVASTGAGWLDVELHGALVTPPAFLESHAVFLEYVEPAGLVRIVGHVAPPPRGDDRPPVVRFSHRDVVQLLRRRTHAGGTLHAAVTLMPATEDGVAHATKTVAVSASEFAVHDLPTAIEGERYHFRIQPGGNEPPVSGSASVVRVAPEGHVILRYDLIPDFERERLGRLLAGRHA